MRGKQTAALLIVDGQRNAIPLVDLRVDHDPDPLRELRRLLRLHRAYLAEHHLPDYIAAGDIQTAHAMLDQIGEWAPDEPYLQYLRALHLAGHLDAWDEALEILKPLLREHPIWEEYLRREAQVDNFGCPGLGTELLQALKPEDLHGA